MVSSKVNNWAGSHFKAFGMKIVEKWNREYKAAVLKENDEIQKVI